MRQGEYPLPFPDRRAAGTLLGERLARAVALENWAERAVVLALPRGGVAVAAQVAAVLDVPMNVIVTRKIGYPRQPELGVGAIAEGLEEAVYDASLLSRLSLTQPAWHRSSPRSGPNLLGGCRCTGADGRCLGWPDGV